MSPITRENIEIKAQRCNKITLNYIEWIEKFKDLRTGKFSISDILYDQVFQKKELISSLMNLTKKKPSIAIYGASQSGKSLFIGRLLKAEETVLLNPDPPGLDFLTHLNPSRGVEATSVVTRFTISSTNSVRAKLMNRSDLIKALGKGFFGEFKFDAPILEDNLRDKFDELSNSKNDDRSWRHDISSAFNYLKKFDNNIYQFDSVILNELLRKNPLSKQGYVDLCSFLFWNNSDVIKIKFSELLGIYDSINTEYINISWRSLPFILDSSAPNKIDNPFFGEMLWNQFLLNDHSLDINNGGINYNLRNIQSIICELEIPIDKSRLKDHVLSLFEKMDILDIPGAIDDAGNSRDVAPSDLDESSVFSTIKRGRVSYFFDKYSNEKQIINLIYMQAWGNIRARGELEPQINNWGKAIFDNRWPSQLTENEVELSPLFIILTQIDKTLVWNNSPESSDFDSNIEGEVANHFKSFMTAYGELEQPFNNTYLLRHPGTCDQTDELPNQNAWGEAFKNSTAVRKYIRDHQNIWDIIFGEDGGLDYLLQKIISHADEQIYLKNLDDLLIKCEEKLFFDLENILSKASGDMTEEKLNEVLDLFISWLENDSSGLKGYKIRKELSFKNGFLDLSYVDDGGFAPVGKTIEFYISRVEQALVKWEDHVTSSEAINDLVKEENNPQEISEAIRHYVSFNKRNLIQNHSEKIAEKIKIIDDVFRNHWSQSKKDDYIRTIFDDYILWSGLKNEVDCSIYDKREYAFLKVMSDIYRNKVRDVLISAARQQDDFLPEGQNELKELYEEFR